MVRGKAGRGPTRVLRVIALPALLRVAHVGEAAQKARPGWPMPPVVSITSGTTLSFLTFSASVVPAARRRSPCPCGGQRARRRRAASIGAEDLAVQVLVLPKAILCPTEAGRRRGGRSRVPPRGAW